MDRFCFSRIRHNRQDLWPSTPAAPTLKSLASAPNPDSQPAFAYLLLPAFLIECHGYIRLFGLEVRGRIIEREVSVLSNSHE